MLGSKVKYNCIVCGICGLKVKYNCIACGVEVSYTTNCSIRTWSIKDHCINCSKNILEIILSDNAGYFETYDILNYLISIKILKEDAIKDWILDKDDLVKDIIKDRLNDKLE